MYIRLQSIAVLLFIATISMAQEVPGAVEKKKKGCSCSFSSLYGLGVLEGQAGGKLQLQTIQGIRYGKWFSGIGVGMDYYHLRSIPVFIDIRREILNRRNSPFIYADGGMHFAWPREQDKPSYGRSEFQHGLYYDVGLGYKIAAGKKDGGILLSAGYSYKYYKEDRIVPVCINWICTEESNEYFRYKLNRLSLKIGVQL